MKQKTTSALAGSSDPGEKAPLNPSGKSYPLLVLPGKPGHHSGRAAAEPDYIKYAKEAAKYTAVGLVVYTLGYWQWSFLGVLIAIFAALFYKQRKEEKKARVGQ